MIETIKEYTSKRIDLLKIEATEKSSISAGVISLLMILLFAFGFFIILFNFGVAFLLGEMLNNIAYGFLIVAAFYFVLTLLVFAFKKKIINMVANKVVEFLNH